MIHHANAESAGATERGATAGLRPSTAPAAEPLIAVSHRLPKRDSQACLASDSHSGRGATARQGGDFPTGLFPWPSSRGDFPDPRAGAAANFAIPAVRVAFPGIRIRIEQRGRSIQRSRLSHPRARAARACSSPVSFGAHPSPAPGTAASAPSLGNGGEPATIRFQAPPATGPSSRVGLNEQSTEPDRLRLMSTQAPTPKLVAGGEQ